MNITLFGGSFNPPHLGHLIVMQQALELIPDINELWLLPAYKHTFEKDLADYPHRINMTKTLRLLLPRNMQNKVKVETIECDQKMPGETYLTILILQKIKPDITFSFLMGTDQLPHLHPFIFPLPYLPIPKPSTMTLSSTSSPAPAARMSPASTLSLISIPSSSR